MAFLYLFCAALPVATAPPQTPEPEPQWFSTHCCCLHLSVCLQMMFVLWFSSHTLWDQTLRKGRSEKRSSQGHVIQTMATDARFHDANQTGRLLSPHQRFDSNASLFKLTFLYWQSLGWSRGTLNPIFLFKIFKIKLTFYDWWSVSLK